MPALIVGNKSKVDQYVAALGTVTHAHTVAAGSNRILLLGSAIEEIGETPLITGITYGGVSLAAVANSEQAVGGVTWVRGQWWWLRNPPTGANNIVLTIGSAGEDANIGIRVADFSNHDGRPPVGGFKSSSASANTLNTGAIPYTDGDVIGAMEVNVIGGNTITWTNATEYSDEEFVSAHESTAFATMAGLGSVTITAASTSTDRMGLTAVRISPVGSIAGYLLKRVPKTLRAM